MCTISSVGRLLVAVIFLASADLAAAQPSASGRITGFVRRQGGEPVIQAMVAVASRDGRIQRMTRTNAQGRFVFPALPPGAYVLQSCAERLGSTDAVDVEIKSDTDVNQDLPIANAADATCETEGALIRGSQEYTGAVMSLDLNGSSQEFFRRIAEISRVDINVDPSIKSPITLHLKNVPWDLALDVVLRTMGLGSEAAGNGLRIGPANPVLGQDRVLMGTVTIAGKVTDFDLDTAILHVSAPNSEGTMQIWPVEWETAAYLRNIGVKADTFMTGDAVIITGALSRTNAIRLISLQRPSDGFSWGYLKNVWIPNSDLMMFVQSK